MHVVYSITKTQSSEMVFYDSKKKFKEKKTSEYTDLLEFNIQCLH